MFSYILGAIIIVIEVQIFTFVKGKMYVNHLETKMSWRVNHFGD